MCTMNYQVVVSQEMVAAHKRRRKRMCEMKFSVNREVIKS